MVQCSSPPRRSPPSPHPVPRAQPTSNTPSVRSDRADPSDPALHRRPGLPALILALPRVSVQHSSPRASSRVLRWHPSSPDTLEPSVSFTAGATAPADLPSPMCSFPLCPLPLPGFQGAVPAAQPPGASGEPLLTGSIRLQRTRTHLERGLFISPFPGHVNGFHHSYNDSKTRFPPFAFSRQ